MKKIFLFVFLILGVWKPVEAQTTVPWAQQMSATQSISLPNGKVVTSKIYIDMGRVRIDVDSVGVNVSSLFLPDKKIMYTIMHAQKVYMELPITPTDLDRYSAFSPNAVNFEAIGEGTMNGVECIKYRLKYETSKAQIFWINKQTKVPVAMEAEDGTMKIDWNNVVVGPQPDSVFELPANYQKMQMPHMPMKPPGQ